MNYSKYIDILESRYGVDFNNLWKETLHLKGEYNKKRAFSDKEESDFWEDFSKKYDSIPSLYDYGPESFEKLLSIVGENKKLLEFGCGTGKFTIPMAKKSKEIKAVDLSKHMLYKLDEKIKNENILNIKLFNSKFEDFQFDEFDSIYSINGNYRIFDMESALKKMNNAAREKVVIVWTMQRNIYDSIINQTFAKGIDRCQEYIHIINILYKIGIDPNLEFLTVNKPIDIDDISVNYCEIKDICENYNLPYEFARKKFDESLISENGKLVYMCKLKVAYIYFEPEFIFD